MAWFDDFLVDREPRRWTTSDGMPASIQAGQVFLQEADYGLEVAVAEASRRPTSADMRKAWKARHGGRPSPVLLAVGYPGAEGTAVAVCGPAGEDPPVHLDLEPSRVERLAAIALAEPTRHSAQRCLLRLLPEVESELPGLVNSGLLATQELRHGVPQRRDWPEATKASQPALTKRGRSLVEALGFTVTQLGANTSLLVAGVEHRAVAVFLDEGEAFDAPGARFEGVSPVSHALAVADREHLSWVVLTRASEIRLYAARPDTGVGRRGPSQTFIEANVALLPDDLAGYLHLLFSADALADGGTFEQILSSSADFAADLASRLRERVYRNAVPALAQAIAARLDPNPDEAVLSASYDQTLNILFRLLFVAYGEDKDLLPYDTNSRYADHSLKRIARRLGDDMNRGVVAFEESAADLWEDVVQIWVAIDRGNKSWGVPPYNGGLFSADRDTNPAGAALAELRLTNAEFGPALAALLVDTRDSDGTVGPVDFRSLSVREFGTIYEGLLESELSVASTDLTLDSKGIYIPATGQQTVEISAGSVYLHNRSGARKATGSYFTKPFAVEHLLDHALEPSLADHLARIKVHLDVGDDAAAAAAFFDFRCADIAMGSGHFLVAAVDRIEARLSAFLALNPIPAVTAELDQLRSAAYEALGDLADGIEIETTSLLRRQVGRRCIYGVDRNEIAVELARLAIWIHTFVPGLPLSFLDHNLVAGDSLTGIGTIDEALIALAGGDENAPTLFRDEIVGFLSRASTALRRLATITDANVADVKAAQAAHLEALEKVASATALFDLLVAGRLDEARVPLSVNEKTVLDAAVRFDVHDVVAELDALHFPVAFPEVFLRDRPGFDCILGNPPWDKVMFEPQQFWVTRVPGLNSLSDAERDRMIANLRAERPADAALEQRVRAERERLQAYIEHSFPHRGRGHYDFAKLFAERAVSLLHERSSLGYVLPANSLLLGGWSKLRKLLLQDSVTSIAQARNKSGWLFEDVDNRYAVCLLARTMSAGADPPGVVIWPGVTSVDILRAATLGNALNLSLSVLHELSDSMVVPWLNAGDDQHVFEAVRSSPSLASGDGWIHGFHDARWDFRGSGPHRKLSSELHAKDAWKILMTRHVGAFRIDESIAFQRFVPHPESLGGGVATRDGRTTLDESHPLVIMRHPSRNDDSRTMIAAALPAAGFVHNKGYVHAVRHAGGTTTSALLALLGFLNTFTCDWWVRRFVDRHVTAPVLNNVRLPSWSKAEIDRASQLTAALLRAEGQSTLAGSRYLPDQEQIVRLDAVVGLEVLAARGFNLGHHEVATMLSDFSERPAACPPQLREAILEALR